MPQELNEQLKRKEMTPLHDKLLSHVVGLAKMSRDHMGQFYECWDNANLVYKGQRKPDKEDRDNYKDGKPIKLVFPLNYAQIHTWVSFLFLLCTQNRNFYELTPTGSEDFKKRPDMEKVLEADIQRNLWPYILFQFLLDVGRFGLGVMETCWTQEYAYFLPSQVAIPTSTDYFEQQPVSGAYASNAPQTDDDGEPTKILRYEGNHVGNISPYRWFPDPRVTIVDFQKGDFCGHEEDMSRTELKRLQYAEEVYGIEHLTDVTNEWLSARGNTRIGFMRNSEMSDLGQRRGGMGNQNSAPDQTLGIDVVTKMQVKIIPNEFEIEVDGPKLGKQKWPVTYYAWVVNDQRIVKFEPTDTLHGMFGYTESEFTADMHEVVSAGMGDVTEKLQYIISWFFNSHIKGVDRVNKNQIVADPEGVDIDAIGSNDSVIKLRRGASKSGVDRWVKQLQVADATAGHMGDVDIITKFVQMITGVNDNAMGQYNSGRRSATEARAVTSGAAGRMKTNAAVIWATGFAPLGKMMLTNARAGMSLEMFMRIVGKPDPTDVVGLMKVQERYTNFKGSIEELVGGMDFFVWDATLNSEKGFMAQSLQELLQVMMTNPVVGQVLDIDTKALFEQMMFLRGVTDVDQFSLSKNVANGTSQLPPPMPPEPQPGQSQQVPQLPAA